MRLPRLLPLLFLFVSRTAAPAADAPVTSIVKLAVEPVVT
jgi:hypothetical protein